MLAGSLLLSITIIAFAIWLQLNESRQWPSDGNSKLEIEYRRKRFRSRSFIHNILIVAGGLIAVAALAGAGRIWIACWGSVMVILLIVMMLAMLDAFRTHRFLKKRLPEIRRKTLDE